MRIPKWTEEQINLLRELYPFNKAADLVEIIGRPRGSILHKAYELKLRKDPEWMRQKLIKTAFTKGHIPATKGKKWDDYLTPEQKEKILKSAFKRGHVPVNKAPVGHERKSKDGYWWVKIAQPNVFKQKHRVLWEQHHGPIPKGMEISFIDGNTDNITIENLQMETKLEKFRRCGCIHNILPPDIKELVMLKGRLKRQLNKIEKNGNNRSHTEVKEDEEQTLGL